MSIETKILQTGYLTGRGKTKKTGPELSLTANTGELVALVGPNGVGKSTLLRTISGLQPPLGGNVFINEKSIENINRQEIATLISFVSTESIKVLHLTVAEMVALGRYPYTNWIGGLNNNDSYAIEKAIALVRIEHLKHNPINEISDGERQRATIARAIAQDTPVIVLDEPTAYLDLQNKYEIVHLLADLAHQEGKTIIFSTHDLNIALSEADKIWLLETEKATQAAPEDFLFNKQLTPLLGNNLIFDPITLSVRRHQNYTQNVSIISNNKTLETFTTRALNRIGLRITQNSQLIIKVISENDKTAWQVELKGIYHTFYSIYELCKMIKKIS